MSLNNLLGKENERSWFWFQLWWHRNEIVETFNLLQQTNKNDLECKVKTLFIHLNAKTSKSFNHWLWNFLNIVCWCMDILNDWTEFKDLWEFWIEAEDSLGQFLSLYPKIIKNIIDPLQKSKMLDYMDKQMDIACDQKIIWLLENAYEYGLTYKLQ